MENSNYTSRLSNMSLCSLVYLMIWATTPPMASGTVYRVLGVVCVGILMLEAVSNQSNNTLGKIVLLIVCICIVSFVVGESFSLRINTIIFLCYCMASLSMSSKVVSYKTAERILMIIFLNCLVWEYFTLKTIASIPNVMRLAVRDSYVAPFGVGGYGFLYVVILFLPISLDILLDKERSLKMRLISGVFSIATIQLSLQSQYFMSMVIVVIMIALLFIYKKSSDFTQTLTVLALLLVLMIMYINAERIIMALLEIFNSGAVSRKLREILSMIQGDTELIDSSEFGTRYERYMRDFLLTIESPIWGTLRYASVGKHSGILDFFAQYGVPLGAVYVSTIVKCISCYRMPVTQTILIGLLVLMGFNSVTYQIGAIFIITPLYFASTGVLEYE